MLGDACRMLQSPEWRQLAEKDQVINEASLRKLMRGQTIRPQHQYWLEFKDLSTAKNRLRGQSDAGFILEERVFDKFMVGLDWCSQLMRLQTASQALVIVSVENEAMIGCLFGVQF